MPTLIVAAHPEADSLTIHVARRIEAALEAAEVADLAGEGFDPRFTPGDRVSYRTGADFPSDVRAEQERLERVTDLVLVFPVYWWSMPALLKGWIDRVFVNGWAFAPGPGGEMQRNLGWLRIHLVPIAGDDAASTSGTATSRRSGPRSSTASSTTAAPGAEPPCSCSNPSRTTPRLVTGTSSRS